MQVLSRDSIKIFLWIPVINLSKTLSCDASVILFSILWCLFEFGVSFSGRVFCKSSARLLLEGITYFIMEC